MNSIINYRPIEAFSLKGDLNRIVNSYFADTPIGKCGTPAVNVSEEDDRYVLEAELPGLSQKDVDVKVEGNLLTLSSAQSEEKKEKTENYLIQERSEYSFKRSFVLPKNADKESISAKFQNGLLVLEIRKRPEEKPRSIEIKVE